MIAVGLTGGILSIASLVGFVTLFGVATRNGLLLVDNYNIRLNNKETVLSLIFGLMFFNGYFVFAINYENSIS